MSEQRFTGTAEETWRGFTVTLPDPGQGHGTFEGWRDEAGALHQAGETLTYDLYDGAVVTFTAQWAQILGLGEVWLEAGVRYRFGPSQYRVGGDMTPSYRHYRISGDDDHEYRGGQAFYVATSGLYTISMAD